MRKPAAVIAVVTLTAALGVPGTGSATCAAPTPEYCSPGIAPPLANDPTCLNQPGKSPVVLVHGTGADMTMSWNLFSPALRAAGYCVWALDLPNRALTDLMASNDVLTGFVENTVLPTSNATGKVSLIGHSQGGLQIRYMLRRHPEIPVDDAISLSGSHHGSAVSGGSYANRFCLGYCSAFDQQLQGSSFYTQLMDPAGADPTPGSASYTQIETRYDEIVAGWPSPARYENTYVDGDQSRTSNILLQDKCPLDTSDHVDLVYDPAALEYALQALAVQGPAAASFVPATCGG